MKKIPFDILVHIFSYSSDFIENPVIFNKTLLKKSKVYRIPILGYDKFTKEEYKHESFIFGNKDYSEEYRLILETNFFIHCLCRGVNMDKSPIGDVLDERVDHCKKEFKQWIEEKYSSSFHFSMSLINCGEIKRNCW